MPAHYHERHIPHWQPEGAALFITWRLYGSLPRGMTFREADQSSGRSFTAVDKVLARAAEGPRWLEEEQVAESFFDTLKYGQDTLHLYDLRAWVIMPNHIHILIDPNADLPRITKAVKNYSARQANAILERKGSPFWQDEAYDRWVRDGVAREKIVKYIESNPVKAGLVSRLEDWRWSSGWTGREACPTKTKTKTKTKTATTTGAILL